MNEVYGSCFSENPPARACVQAGLVKPEFPAEKALGRHLIFPLHASIQERCRRLGFDNVAPIIWHKIANAQYEMGAGGCFGKPYEPNGILKNDNEFIKTMADAYQARFGGS